MTDAWAATLAEGRSLLEATTIVSTITHKIKAAEAWHAWLEKHGPALLADAEQTGRLRNAAYHTIEYFEKYEFSSSKPHARGQALRLLRRAVAP